MSGAVQDQGASRGLAGVQIRLDPGWHTYWRSPGDSGVPPQFDWSGSKNLKQAQVLYPAPHRFADANGSAIGYEDEVVFPVKITPERPDEPVELKLNVAYGLCKTLCIPNEASLSLDLPPQVAARQTQDLLLERFVGLVPKPVAQGELPALGGVEAKLDAAKPELRIDALFPEGATGSDLFIESRRRLRSGAEGSKPARRRQAELCGQLRLDHRGGGHQGQAPDADACMGRRRAGDDLDGGVVQAVSPATGAPRSPWPPSLKSLWST